MSMLEHIITFCIEKDSFIEQCMNRSGRTFEGLLRDQVKAAYDTVNEPYRKIRFKEKIESINVADLKYTYQDQRGTIVFDLGVNVSDGPVFLTPKKEKCWPGRIYVGIDYEHSDFSGYPGGETRELDILPVVGFATQVSGQLLSQKISFQPQYFINEIIMNNKLDDQYGKK